MRLLEANGCQMSNQLNISIIYFQRLKLRLRLCTWRSLKFLFLIKLQQYIGLDVKIEQVSVKTIKDQKCRTSHSASYRGCNEDQIRVSTANIMAAILEMGYSTI